MRRWLAYSGSPITIETVLLETEHSLNDQSLHARMGVETTNGDGFGIGWYGDGLEPGVYRSTGPAWKDQNLQELAALIKSGLFLAHIRASTGTAIQQTNCYPFRYREWLWMHNGTIRNFDVVKRELVLAVDPAFYTSIGGSTDSELMFYLALSLGLNEKPFAIVCLRQDILTRYFSREDMESKIDAIADETDEMEEVNERIKRLMDKYTQCVEDQLKNRYLKQLSVTDIDKELAKSAFAEQFADLRLSRLQRKAPMALSESQRAPFQDSNWDQREDTVPLWIIIVRVLFMCWTIVNAHNPAHTNCRSLRIVKIRGLQNEDISYCPGRNFNSGYIWLYHFY